MLDPLSSRIKSEHAPVSHQMRRDITFVEEAVVIPLKQARLAREFRLSKRQGEVMALLIQGKTYKAIGGVLCVSENTIRSHVKKIYAKARVTSRAELLHLLLNPPNAPIEAKQPANPVQSRQLT